MNKLVNILKFPLSILLFGSLMPLNTSCSKVTYSRVKWQPTPVVADGKPIEWNIPLKFFDKESKLNYDISNDKTNLYVIFKITDDLTKMRVLNSGMQFAIDVNGKKAFPVTINYPLSSEHNVQGEPNEVYTGEGGSVSEDAIRAATKRMMRLSGFNKDIKDGLVPQKNEYGIQASMTVTGDDILYYELLVPFKTFYKETLTTADTINPFSFQIALNPLAEGKANPLDDDGSNNSQNGAGSGNMPGGAGGGMPGGGGSMPGGAGGGMPGGGGSGGGMQHHRSADAAPGSEKHLITQKLKLSLK